MTNTALLTMTGISKSFPGVKALDNVHMTAHAGEVVGLLGENGAGKSTLMKILSGIYTPDAGDIRLEGEPITLRGPRHSQSVGISIIHQELNLLPHLTVAENIYIQNLPTKGMSFDKKKLYQDTQRLLDELGFEIDPKSLVGDLSVGTQQMVEIAKALSFQAKVIIMDEPTSAITEQETAKLFEIIRSLRDKGIAIIYISHRMEEIYAICDRVVVLRDGCNAGDGLARELMPEQIVKMLVGRELTQIFPERSVTPGEDVVLEVKRLSRKGAFSDISFRLHKGEILGFSGMMGSGRTELMEAIFGFAPATGGEIWIDGALTRIRSTRDTISRGFALVPEDRRHQGMIGNFSVAQNISLTTLKKIAGLFQKINGKKEREIAERYIDELRIRPANGNAVMANLSGGNQQKAILAKWLETKPAILILDEPTRGIDIGAKAEIYQIIQELSRQGTSIIVISSELPEVIGLADRILVMADGRITGAFSREEATPERIMLCATKGGVV
ncbi:sugar ABC transporter ATP-binding protein [Brevibacillus fluminis]|uniref:sugar ABC transporter ATP-binding protein n=1 Tax=Brevibacillus fluminis TaxID=511487 RepID=UPI003F89497A